MTFTPPDEWWKDGAPVGLDGAACDALVWLDLMHAKFGGKLTADGRGRLERCLNALEKHVRASDMISREDAAMVIIYVIERLIGKLSVPGRDTLGGALEWAMAEVNDTPERIPLLDCLTVEREAGFIAFNPPAAAPETGPPKHPPPDPPPCIGG